MLDVLRSGRAPTLPLNEAAERLHDRLTEANHLPSLATLIERRAQDLRLSASWGFG